MHQKRVLLVMLQRGPFNLREGKQKQHRKTGFSADSQNTLQPRHKFSQIRAFQELIVYCGTFLLDVTLNIQSHTFSLNIKESVRASQTGLSL